MKKRILYFIIFLFGSIMVFAQNIPKTNLDRIDMKNTILEIRTLYGTNPIKYPDSISTKYYLAMDALRSFDLKEEISARSKWSKESDSIIQLKIINLKPKAAFGFGLAINQVFISAQYAFVVNRYRNFDVGIGSGIEYVNRGNGLVQVLQMPVYITNNVFLGKFGFLNFDYGFTIPLSGSYKDMNDKEVDYKESELNNRFYFDLGIGNFFQSNLGVQLNIRNQSLGVPEPLNQRVWMFGLKLSF